MIVLPPPSPFLVAAKHRPHPYPPFPRNRFTRLQLPRNKACVVRASSEDANDTTEENGLKRENDAGKEHDTHSENEAGVTSVKASGDIGTLPKRVLDIIRDQVFGFDTFFVTDQEAYEGGVLFKGNLRGNASKSYAKINMRLQNNFGDQYRLFLFLNPGDDKPVASIIPKELLEPDPSSIPDWAAASLFGLVTLVTVLLRNSPSLQVNFLSTFDNYELLLEGLPGAFVTLAILAAHESGHIYAAQNIGAKLGLPYFIPSLQLGSFGGITRITSILSTRQDLLKIAAAGPLAGGSLSLIIVLIGFILSPSDGQGIIVNASAFHDSFIVGVLAKAFLGDSLKEGSGLAVNPLVLWAWAGLLINGINSIPVGELDGGRISQALWGRKVWSRVNGISIALLGFSALFSDVSLYWVVLVLFLQRGPITPQAEEISSPDQFHVALGVAVLLMPLLICLPFPFPF